MSLCQGLYNLNCRSANKTNISVKLYFARDASLPKGLNCEMTKLSEKVLENAYLIFVRIQQSLYDWNGENANKMLVHLDQSSFCKMCLSAKRKLFNIMTDLSTTRNDTFKLAA